jgi:CDP-glucose 4,6-dehydratase
MFNGAFSNKNVWVSGHTGFKGAWLCQWLVDLGANVYGYSLSPPTQPALFEQLDLSSRLIDERNDIRDGAAVLRSIETAQPDFVFHLAAQSLVRQAYVQPVETYEVNVLGTVNILQGLRSLRKPCAAVFVTTDKCYENREWAYGYRETDPLGGHDPYSSSKAAAEIAIASFRKSFFKEHSVKIASARAGNVIGGGDWAQDRIVPDCIRALKAGDPISVRNRNATRPWQHVLEPLSGYLWLGACLASPRQRASGFRDCSDQRLESAFNFGPDQESNRTVAELVGEILKHMPGVWEDRSVPDAVHEAYLLQLAIDKARSFLHWSPVWKFPVAVKQTVDWYSSSVGRTVAGDLSRLTAAQIEQYTTDARALGLPWASSNS